MPNRNAAKVLSKKPVENSPKVNAEKSVNHSKTSSSAQSSAEAFYISYPDFKIDTETALGKVSGLGHAGVLLVSPTGATKYFEFGRYKTSDGTKGKVRTQSVPNAQINKNGVTKDSLEKIFSSLSSKSGQNGKINAARFQNLDFQQMQDYAQSKFLESNPGNPQYNKKRLPYSLTSNNCGQFVKDVIERGGNVPKPTIINPAPNNIVDEYWEDGLDKITYDPSSKKVFIEPQ